MGLVNLISLTVFLILKKRGNKEQEVSQRKSTHFERKTWNRDRVTELTVTILTGNFQRGGRVTKGETTDSESMFFI